MNTLSKRNKEIVLLRAEGNTLAEVGKSFGITRERVRQIINKAMSKKHGTIIQQEAQKFNERRN